MKKELVNLFGPVVGICLFVLIAMLWIGAFLLAFPEISVFFLLASVIFDEWGMYDPLRGAEQLDPFQIFYPEVSFLYEHLGQWHTVFKILFIVGIPIIYIILAKFVHIKGFYFVQVAGAFLTAWCTYLILSKIVLLDYVWSIFLTILISIITLALRKMVLNSRNVLRSE